MFAWPVLSGGSADLHEIIIENKFGTILKCNAVYNDNACLSKSAFISFLFVDKFNSFIFDVYFKLLKSLEHYLYEFTS